MQTEGIICTVRPVTRRIRLAYWLALIAAVVCIIRVEIFANPRDRGSESFFLFVMLGLALLAVFAWHAMLRSSVYTITPEYIEGRSKIGIIEQHSRRIPIAYIRAVTADADITQQLYNLGSVTVSATNGDSIVFRDIPDPEATRDIISQLIAPTVGR